MSQGPFSPIAEAILHTIDVHKEEIISFTRDLLRIPSVNSPPRGDEKQAQEFLARRFLDLGLEPDLFYLDQLPELEQHAAYQVGGSVEIPSGAPAALAGQRRNLARGAQRRHLGRNSSPGRAASAPFPGEA